MSSNARQRQRRRTARPSSTAFRPRDTRTVRVGADAEVRFWAKVDRRDSDECWYWRAATASDGYGIMSLQGRNRYAHRLAWAIVHGHGVLPPGHLLVRHHCDNPPCVNPAHLTIGTVTMNLRDAESRGRRVGPPEASPLLPLLRWANSKYLAATGGYS